MTTKSDVGGSDWKSVAGGQEKYRQKYSHRLRKTMWRFEHRATDGELFQTAARTLEECQERRDRWLREREAKSMPESACNCAAEAADPVLGGYKRDLSRTPELQRMLKGAKEWEVKKTGAPT